MSPSPRRLSRGLIAGATVTLSVLTLLAGCRSEAHRTASDASPAHVTVALKGPHQAQFAGWYVGMDEGFFASNDVDVTTIAGDRALNPLALVLSGRADIAEATMDQAVAMSHDGHRFVNIAQLFVEPASLLICRTSPGFESIDQIDGKEIAAGARDAIVREVLHTALGRDPDVRFTADPADQRSLLESTADCVWGTVFQDYWRVLAAGVDVFTLTPTSVGAIVVDNGLYVDEARLDDPAFREQLVAVVRGLESAWAFVAEQPTTAVGIIRSYATSSVALEQQRQLESVEGLIGDTFGYLDVAAFERVDGIGVPTLPDSLADRLWTHEVYDDYRASLGESPFVSSTTRHYVILLRRAPWFTALIDFGVFAAAASGALLGTSIGYRLWGRLVLALVTSLGGGILRDLLIGGSRYPTYLIHHPRDIITSAAAVAVVRVMTSRHRWRLSLGRLDTLNRHADVIGFTVLAVNGAMIAVVMETHVIWVPLAAAFTVAGGGVLSNILTGRRTDRFRGEIYEETAIIGSLVFLAGLRLANLDEHLPVLVVAATMVSLAVNGAMRWSVERRGWRYPTFGDDAEWGKYLPLRRARTDI